MSFATFPNSSISPQIPFFTPQLKDDNPKPLEALLPSIAPSSFPQGSNPDLSTFPRHTLPGLNSPPLLCRQDLRGRCSRRTPRALRDCQRRGASVYYFPAFLLRPPSSSVLALAYFTLPQRHVWLKQDLTVRDRPGRNRKEDRLRYR